jgi:hypothetical protein
VKAHARRFEAGINGEAGSILLPASSFVERSQISADPILPAAQAPGPAIPAARELPLRDFWID